MRSTRLLAAAALLAAGVAFIQSAAAQGTSPPPPPAAEHRAGPPGPGPHGPGPHGPGPQGPRPHGPGPHGRPGLATQEDAMREVGHAYDRLRVVGLMATSVNGGDQSVTALTRAGKAAYDAALSRYKVGNYTSARELAMAAGALAGAADHLVASQLRTAGGGPLALAAPPTAQVPAGEIDRAKTEALRASEHAARVDSVTRSLPAKDPARGVASIARGLAERARRAAQDNDLAEASALTRAADASARAAEHLYADYYVSRGSAPPVAPGPAAPPPPPPPPPPADR